MPAKLFVVVLTALFCSIFNTAFAQHFTLQDSLLHPSPDWTGDTAAMNFTAEGLRTAAPGAGTLYWRRPSRAGIRAHWNLHARMEFNPSSANFAEFHFLIHPAGTYLLRLSGNSTDDLSLVLRTAEEERVLAALPGYLDRNMVDLHLRITRDSNYTFSVYDADSLLLSATDSTVRNAVALGLFCQFTASRVDKFLFSTLEVAGDRFYDTRPPQLLGIDVLSPRSLRLRWSEPCVPAAGFTNAVVAGRDTAYYPYLEPQAWLAEFEWPLPLGPVSVSLDAAQDSAGNLALPPPQEVVMRYTPAKSAQITAVHQIEGAELPYFLLVQADSATGPLSLHVLEEDGDRKSYALAGLDTLTLIASEPVGGWGIPQVVVPGLKLAREATLILEKEGIPLAVQPYDAPYADHEENGAYLLAAPAVNGTLGQWEVWPTTALPRAKLPVSAPPPNRVTGLYATPSGALFADFEHPLFPYLTLSSEVDGHGAVTDAQWSILRPYGLMFEEKLALQHPEGRLDTTLAFLAVHPPEPGDVLINEIHHSPERTQEFVELAVGAERAISLKGLLLRATSEEGAVSRAGELSTGPPAFCENCPYHRVLYPGSFTAFSTPFSLLADSTELLLTDPWGDVVDAAFYLPQKAPYDHRSWERISLLSSGRSPLNWGVHLPKWGAETEGSPGAPNSIAQIAGAPFAEDLFTLDRTYVSWDPQDYQPIAHLRVRPPGPGKLWLSVVDLRGLPVAELVGGMDLAGEEEVQVQPGNWPVAGKLHGTYLLVAHWEGPAGTAKKILPLSLYNP